MGTQRYVIRGGVEGRERLRVLSAVFGPSTRALLSDAGLPRGSVCFDLGCGSGDVTFEIAQAIGPSGRAIGVDLDETKVAIARRESAQQGLTNITFEVGDVTEWEPREPFDVVYARFLLSHLPGPERLVADVRQRIRSGGVLIVEDIDFRGHFSEPACPALSRYVEFYTRSVQTRGGDPHVGPKLPGLLREAGFDEIQMKLVHPAALEGGIKLLSCITLQSIAEAVLQDGITAEEELNETIKQLYDFARDPHTLLGGPHVFQVWGRKGE